MCDKCRDYNGQWQMTGRGLIRCDCPGNDAVRKLADAAEHPRYNRPTITAAQASAFVEALAVIPYFPGEVGARTAIGDEIRALCAGVVEAGWLVTRMRRLYRRWPGPCEMRHVYAGKYMPWDGLLPIGMSEVYPDGIPPESEQKAKGLSAGAGDKQIAASVKQIATAHVIPVVRAITDADVNAARQANRDARARTELGEPV
jgi:hypothetical protein